MKSYSTLFTMSEAYDYPYDMFRYWLRCNDIVPPKKDNRYYVSSDMDRRILIAINNHLVRKKKHAYVNHAGRRFRVTLKKMFTGDERTGDERAAWYVKRLEDMTNET